MSRINTNIESLIARRALSQNNASLNRTLVRLSTGLRINSGRDDPAGLIASETLRSSMRAITTAIDNANRADTIVSVAEGGLQEVSSLLLELESLVDQTANEAGLTKAEIGANQMQIDSILQSINRLANATAFGDKKLLNGNLDFTTSGVNIDEATGTPLTHLDRVQINAAKIPAGAFRTVNINVVAPSEVAIVEMEPAGVDGGGLAALDGATTMQIRGNYGSEILSFASGATAAEMATAVNASKELTGVSATASSSGGGPTELVLQSTSYGSDQFVSVSLLENTAAFVAQAEDVNDYGVDGDVTVNGTSAIVSGLDIAVRSGALAIDATLDPTFGGQGATGNTTFEITGGGAVFSISPTVGLSGMESIGIGEVSTAQLGSSGTGFLASLGSGLTHDLASKDFTSAQRIVRAAIDQIAGLRGRLGGFQKDTLATTINSLGVALENVTAAESAIRDADFAKETADLTRSQIMVAASTSVLRLANATPQNVLSLLA